MEYRKNDFPRDALRERVPRFADDNVDIVDIAWDRHIDSDNFRNNDFRHIDFSFTNISESSFVDCDFMDCEFLRANIINSRFEDSDLSNTNFRGSHLFDTSFKNSRLDNSVFTFISYEDLISCNFDNAILSDARFSSLSFLRHIEEVQNSYSHHGFNIYGTPLFESVNTDYSKFDFRNVRFLRGSVFRFVDFSKSDFRGADLSKTEFINCTFKGAEFDGAIYSTLTKGLPSDVLHNMIHQNL